MRERDADQLDLQALHRVRAGWCRVAQQRSIDPRFPHRAWHRVRTAHRLAELTVRHLEKRATASPRMIAIIQGLYEDWQWLDERIETLTAEIEEISHKEVNCRRLMSVPGVGPVISTAMVAAIGAGDAFERGRDFGAWLGLVPRQYSTGGKPILGRISKRGSKYLRTLFIQAANVVLMRPQNWERFSFGAWLANAVGRMHRNKPATALANKLARIAWSVLRYRTRFDETVAAINGRASERVRELRSLHGTDSNAHPASVIHNGRSTACPLPRPTVPAYSHEATARVPINRPDTYTTSDP